MTHSPWKTVGQDPAFNNDLMLDIAIRKPPENATKEWVTARTTIKDFGKSKQFIMDVKEGQRSFKYLIEANRLISG